MPRALIYSVPVERSSADPSTACILALMRGVADEPARPARLASKLVNAMRDSCPAGRFETDHHELSLSPSRWTSSFQPGLEPWGQTSRHRRISGSRAGGSDSTYRSSSTPRNAVSRRRSRRHRRPRAPLHRGTCQHRYVIQAPRGARRALPSRGAVESGLSIVCYQPKPHTGVTPRSGRMKYAQAEWRRLLLGRTLPIALVSSSPT
jgi:hypothetical protein